MPINLDLAISSAVRFPQTIDGFNATLRLSHKPGLGWHVSELNLLQRLYYLLFSCFGVSLAEENKALLEKNFKVERETDRKSGKLGDNAQKLIEALGWTPRHANALREQDHLKFWTVKI